MSRHQLPEDQHADFVQTLEREQYARRDVVFFQRAMARMNTAAQQNIPVELSAAEAHALTAWADRVSTEVISVLRENCDLQDRLAAACERWDSAVSRGRS